MKLSYDLQPDDFAVAQAVAARLACKSLQRYAFVSNFITWLFAGIGCMVAVSALSRDPNWAGSSLLVVTVALGLAFVLQPIFASGMRAAFVRSQREALGPFPVSQSVTIDESGISVESRFGASRVPWDAVQATECSGDHIVVALKSGNVIAVPPSAFTDSSPRQDLLTFLRSRAAP